MTNRNHGIMGGGIAQVTRGPQLLVIDDLLVGREDSESTDAGIAREVWLASWDDWYQKRVALGSRHPDTITALQKSERTALAWLRLNEAKG